ncbi:glycosyltransferase [Mesorhizobium sp.]|uniref:glycosyltransferase n=1 Tax=Mesorhizobium sp. TaxID=1871066 RepID=UPI000FEA7E70|nr:glycosyltransferase [Mesorhizobium sp.]RWK41455.1 MAG: glycosyltransferase [Mesorhizobium sp.]RWK68391.1 MAG: glycosyltransferase [Mesorhizobium sp.]RWK72312.1 MAG: glycosyltransferase [Mesorhizobium sp.]RWK84169.1 MAG: glycosyltransferase [Mesorhizobium sp.]RWL05846.1 MAG: glycosyltransferase [Mesorhizobium sp.]
MAKRIVFHIASLRGGGAERVFVLMANELASRGHDVTLFTWNAEGPNAALRSPAVHLVDFALPIRGEGYGKWETLKGIVRSARLFSRLAPHAVYSAPEFANLVVALALLLARSRARFFPSFHAAASLPSSSLGARIAIWLSALVAARATKAIAVSAGVGRDIAARGFPQLKIVVINNPLPPVAALQQDPHAWQAQLATMGDGPVIATAGRLVPVKDHRTLLRAFAILRAGRRARLVIFGEGPLAAELRACAEETGIDADVLFAGYVNSAACYAAADLFVLSSTSEGFGNVLVEAMAAGVPVVSTDAPHGPREILGDGRFGALVPVGNAAAMAKAMADMLDRPTSAAILKSRAADFEVEKIGDLYEALL